MKRPNMLQNYSIVLIGQVVLIFLGSFIMHSVVYYMLFALALFGVLGSVIKTVWTSRVPRNLSIICAAIVILSGFLAAIPGVLDDISIEITFICAMAFAVFVLIAIFSISKSVFITDRVTTNRIVGSICLYLLIGMFFAFIYGALDLLHSDTFNISTSEANITDNFGTYLYFSYTTLTTVGFGDITPVKPIARTIASMESIIGPVYLAIMVARLVGMHITQSMKK